MMTAKMLTDAEIERRLTAARDAEKRARARVAQLRRGLAGASRRAEMQRLCTLGRAVSAWAESDERVMRAYRAHLVGYITRDTDKAILVGTPYDVTPAPAPEPSHG